MKNFLAGLLILGMFSVLSPVFAVPPPPPHGGMHSVGRRMPPPPPPRYHNRVHGGISYNSYYGYRYNSGYYCPCYGVCYPFRHPGPQYSTGFHISF